MGGNQRTAPKVVYSAIGSDFSQVHVPVIQYQGPCGVSLWLPDVEANLTPINKTPRAFRLQIQTQRISALSPHSCSEDRSFFCFKMIDRGTRWSVTVEWISQSQSRFILITPQRNTESLISTYIKECISPVLQVSSTSNTTSGC